MKSEAVGKFYIVDGKLKLAAENSLFQKIEKPSIYEVLRVVDGVPLFFEEHLSRMERSAQVIDYKIKRDSKEIEKDIEKLIQENQIKNQNIKLLSTDIEGIGEVFLIYFIESFYPPKKYYEEGIDTILFDYERKNPNAKIQMIEFREEVKRELDKKEAFEALLVNEEGYIPEGSRSNIFFVRGEKIYTGSKKDILLGITRKYIFEVCEKLNIGIIEGNIHVDDLNKMDGAFMSGTSVNVLPIRTIDDIEFDSTHNKMIDAINNGYVEIIKNYIKDKNKA